MKNLMEQYPDLSWKNHNEKCIEAKISRLLEKRKKLARNKETTRLEHELSLPFEFPKSNVEKVAESANLQMKEREQLRKLTEGTKLVIKENRELKRKFSELTDELQESKLSYDRALKKQDIILGILQYIETKYQNAIKTKHENIHELEKECEELEKKFKQQSDKLDHVNETVISLKEKLGKIDTRNVNKRIKRRDLKSVKKNKKMKN